MKGNLTAGPGSLGDTSLIELSLAGDREAFGQLVARHQSAICALAYSACGNVARSEDLAQEIFITAWRKLDSLEEPSRFRAWLYGIARNLINNAFRQSHRNPIAGADSLEDAAETPSPVDTPDEQTISKEEESLLWRVLSGMPEIYREPMVLYYRQQESVEQVASALAISEEVVRQRLSRGRALLSERVTKVVQNGLRRSGPADTFAVAVIASLPAVAAATTAKGAIMGIATTESATGQAIGVVGFLKNIGFFAGLLAIPAALGVYFGHKLGQDAAGLPQQRKSAAKFWIVFSGGIVLFLFLPLLLSFGVTGFLQGETRAQFLSAMTWWLGWAYLLVPGTLVYWAWQRRRHHPDSTSSPTIDQSESSPRLAGSTPGSVPRRISQRLVQFMTVAAAALLVFCYTDTHHNVVHLSPDELRNIINQSTPAELRVGINVSHHRPLSGGSPGYRYFWVEGSKNGKTVTYMAEDDEATLALITQKGIPCRTYIQGRDYEVLGTPGRLLPLLGGFVFAIGAIFLLQRRRPASSGE